MKARVKEIVNNRWLIFGLRAALGGIFIAAGISKLRYSDLFVDTVVGYGILPNSLAEFYGSVLPWVELFIGLSLVLGIFSRFASALSIPIIVSFIVANVYGLFRTVEDICSCFGPLISLSHPVSLAIDVVMLAMAVPLLLRKDKAEFLGIGPLLSRRYLRLRGIRRFILEYASKLTIIALAMIIGIAFYGEAESSGAQSLNDEIDSALESGKLVLLGFHAGCPVCLAPVNRLQPEYHDRIHFIDINYLRYPQTKQDFEVEVSPTVLLITGKDDGEYVVYKRFEETLDEEELRDSFDLALGSEAP